MTINHDQNQWNGYEGPGFFLMTVTKDDPPGLYKSGPLFLYVHRWSAELEEVMRRSKMTGVSIYDWDDPAHGLDFLAKFTEQLRFLWLTDKAIPDRSVVSALVNLEDLSITGNLDGLDFSQLSHLQTCMIQEAPSLGNIGACPALTKLDVRQTKVEDLAVFAPLPHLADLLLYSVPLRSLHNIERLQALRKLDFTQCRRLESLDGIEQMQIEELWLDYLPRLRSIAPLTKLPTLRKLEIGSCKQIEDLERIAESSSLETLWITTGREIPSLAFLRSMKNMRDFRTFGTKIVDGNLGLLLELPKLEQVVIHRHMRHYSHTEEQLNAVLQARRQSANQEKR